jgi:hypothetical protein
VSQGPAGNGSGKFNVSQQDMCGWVRIFTTSPDVPAELALYLSHALTAWFRDHTDLRLRCVAPVQRGGDTVELHAWYDQHSFRDVSPLARPAS